MVEVRAAVIAEVAEEGVDGGEQGKVYVHGLGDGAPWIVSNFEEQFGAGPGSRARYTVDFLGNDNLVYSTDYPHGDSRYPAATETFLELPLTDEDKRKILWDNCARFYAVEAPAAAKVAVKG